MGDKGKSFNFVTRWTGACNKCSLNDEFSEGRVTCLLSLGPRHSFIQDPTFNLLPNTLTRLSGRFQRFSKKKKTIYETKSEKPRQYFCSMHVSRNSEVN